MIKSAYAILALLGFSIQVFGQSIENMPLANKQSILNNRAFFNFPADAKNVARQADIMAADPNTNIETRIIYDKDEERLVFFARDLYVTGGNNMQDGIKNYEETGGSKDVLLDKDSLLAILETPDHYDSTASAILVKNLFVKTPDNAVFVIGAYINPIAYKHLNEYQKLSERVFASLTKGTRHLHFETRTESHPIFNGTKGFLITLPKAYVVTKDKSYDFEVLKLHKFTDISDTNWVSLTIYTGNYPSYFFSDEGFNETQAQKVSGKFLDKKVDWLSFKNTAQPLYLKEQQIPSNEIESNLVVHIAMLSNNPQGIEELTKLVEDIKLQDLKK